MRAIVFLALVLVAACGRQAEPEAADEREAVGRESAKDVGRIYHYVRSNVDGTEKEDVYVFRKTADELEVYKAREKCTNAALVTAKLDLDRGHATRIVGGRLLPQAERREFAFLDFDARTRTIRARVEVPDGPTLNDEAIVEDLPWHLYDFDFASLTVMTPKIEPRSDFSFGLALLIADPNRADFLQYLGRADATYRKDEVRNGRASFRYVLGGPAFGTYGGSLWLDAEEGHILDVETGIPNHLEYRDFKLELEGVDDGGAGAWRDLLVAHFEGCE
jgi:hypothetical protein